MKKVLLLSDGIEEAPATRSQPNKMDHRLVCKFLAHTLIVDRVFGKLCAAVDGPLPPLHLCAKKLYTSCAASENSGENGLPFQL